MTLRVLRKLLNESLIPIKNYNLQFIFKEGHKIFNIRDLVKSDTSHFSNN